MLRTMVYLSMKDGYRERDEVDWDCTHDIIMHYNYAYYIHYTYDIQFITNDIYLILII